MAKITKVPNGPLIKKKGPFKGSTLRTGGVVKKAQVGDTITVKKPTWQKMTPAQRAAIKADLGPEKFKKYKDSVSTDATNRREDILNRNAAARGMTREQVRAQQEKDKKKPDAVKEDLTNCTSRTDKKGSCTTGNTGGGQSTKDNKRNGGNIMKKAQNGVKATKDSTDYFKSRAAEAVFERGKTRNKNIVNKSSASKKSQDDKNAVDKINNLNNSVNRQSKKGKPGYDSNGYPLKKKAKSGAMIKRADGSMSRRGLWDNIRANKGSGKKPTKQMLVQEKKIKAKSKK